MKIKHNGNHHVARSTIALVLCGVLSISGCQTLSMRSDTPLTSEEQSMREQGDVFNKTVLGGIATGALAGAATGALIRRDIKGVIIGAVVGAILGGTTGYYLAQKQKQYANQEQRMDAMIADVRADNERVAGLIVSSKKVMAADLRKIKMLEQQIAAGTISEENVKRALARVDDNAEYLQRVVEKLKKKHEDWESIAAKTRAQSKPRQIKHMNDETKQLEQHIASLEKELDTLIQRRQILPVA